MKFNFKSKIVLVTGCNGNLGSKITKTFLNLNANVIGIDYDTKSILKSKKFTYYSLDLSNNAAIDNFFYKKIKNKIYILVNNAAISHKGLFENRTTEQINDTFAINLFAPLKLIKHVCSKKNKSNEKVIVNISSIYGSFSPDHDLYKENKKNNSEIYGATKAGLIQITKYFAKYYSGKKIRFNCISPGGFLDSTVVKDKVFLKKYSSKVPLGRMGNPEEIVPAVIFLCSEHATYINGHNLIIDGGLSS